MNRRFADGWALYNNVAWSETDTTGGGVWWNNTDSGYLELAHVNLGEGHIEDCQESQTEPDRRTGRTRTYPEDCYARLSNFIGLPGSMINQRGPNHVYDRTWIYNSFGFKTWRIGNQDLTLGGHLTFQTGTPWYRSEGAGVGAAKTCAPGASPSGLRTCPPITPSDPTSDARPGTANSGIGVRLFPAGAEGHRTADEYTVNLSGAWGFPMGYRDVRGELRVEVLNATNQQRRRDWDGRGEVYPVRRFFQRPRTIRANIKFRF